MRRLFPTTFFGGWGWIALGAFLYAANGVELPVATRVLEIEAEQFEPARTNQVAVVLSGEGNENAVGFTLRFDPAQLEFVGAALAEGTAPGVVQINSSETGRGLVGVAIALPVGRTWTADKGAIVKVSFATGAFNGVSTSIQFGDELIRRQLVTVDAITVSARYEDVTVQIGEVEQQPTISLSGQIRYYAGSKPVPGVELAVAGGVSLREVSSLDGTFHFRVPAGGSYRLTARITTSSGDIRGVTTADIAVIQRHLLGIELFHSPFQLLAADVDLSGSVTAADIDLLREKILGLRSTLPAGDWRFVPSDFRFQDPAQPWDVSASRDYPAAQTDSAGQDFIAVQVGDVNGSW